MLHYYLNATSTGREFASDERTVNSYSMDSPTDHKPLARLVATVFVVILVTSYVVSLLRWRARSHGRPLPPGPRSLPFLGNKVHMSKPELWRANADLCKVYGASAYNVALTCSPETHIRLGDVVYVPVLGQSTILLGSQESISDLLDKRSAITSDRQESPLVAL